VGAWGKGIDILIWMVEVRRTNKAKDRSRVNPVSEILELRSLCKLNFLPLLSG